jgi:hypothetical protein
MIQRRISAKSILNDLKNNPAANGFPDLPQCSHHIYPNPVPMYNGLARNISGLLFGERLNFPVVEIVEIPAKTMSLPL